MAGDLYWVSALVYAVVLLIILLTDFYIVRRPSKVEQSYRRMLGWVIFFCAQDMLWGLCEVDIVPSDNIFFLSSAIFHWSTALTTYFWLKYVLSYLGDEVRHRRLIMLIDEAVILFIASVVCVNFFTPVMFRIENGIYVTKYMRNVTFSLQYAVYFCIGLITLVCSIRAHHKRRKKFMAVFFFALVPILMGTLQLKYPDGPFYSLGYFLGCFIAYVFVVSKERENAIRNEIFKPIADIYHTMHLIDLKENTFSVLLDTDELHALYRDVTDPQEMINNVMDSNICEEYRDIWREFMDLSTIDARLRDRKTINCELISNHYGWINISFFPVEKENDEITSVILATRVIDEEKRMKAELLFNSNNDEMTGLYNRRAYVEDMLKYKDGGVEADFNYLSVDVNGLKVVNDSLGHLAGDELIIGVGEVLKECFAPYGKAYRIGGDEFCAIFYADEAHLAKIKEELDEAVQNWSGKTVDRMYVSCGYVSRAQDGELPPNELVALADERMYQAKTEFYREKGIDRRGQKDAHIALCALYTKILRVNLTDNTYQIVNMDEDEKVSEKGFADTFSQWVEGVANSGIVHADDVKEYLDKMNIDYMRQQLRAGKKTLAVFYRRLIAGNFKRVMLEIIPTKDYSDTNQTIYLYIKSIDG